MIRQRNMTKTFSSIPTENTLVRNEERVKVDRKSNGRILGRNQKEIGPEYYHYINDNIEEGKVKGVLQWSKSTKNL